MTTTGRNQEQLNMDCAFYTFQVFVIFCCYYKLFVSIDRKKKKKKNYFLSKKIFWLFDDRK